jgi:hypothetical protein
MAMSPDAQAFFFGVALICCIGAAIVAYVTIPAPNRYWYLLAALAGGFAVFVPFFIALKGAEF